MVISKELDQITLETTNTCPVVNKKQDYRKWVKAKFEEVTAILPENSNGCAEKLQKLRKHNNGDTNREKKTHL